MKQKQKNETGAIIIEATISLTAFMFAIVTMLTIVNICIVQARMAYALNNTAKEISQYSYIYALTGLNASQKQLYDNGVDATKPVDNILKDVNKVYNEIENLGNSGKHSPENIDDIMGLWDDLEGSAGEIKNAGQDIEKNVSAIAEDPKNLMFGIAKLGASKGMDVVKSKLIAAPLAKGLIQKHLVSEKGGDVEAYLKHLGVVPSPTGSYMGGLDFGESMLFPNGSNEIRINVEYDVKIIALLPIDFTFHFNQTAVTHGWLAGEVTFETFEPDPEKKENDTLWTKATVQERSDLIRNMVIKDLGDDGYAKTSGLTDVQLYSSEKNEFVMISSMNPLWSGEGEPSKSLEDLSDTALQNSIELLCGKAKSTTVGLKTVTTKTKSDGTTSKKENDCAGATTKIMLVIPEDEGLKERIEAVVAGCEKRGVTVEVVPSYGNGARTTEVTGGKEGAGE